MPKLPDVEFMIVLQWMFLVGGFIVFTTFVSTWASHKAKEIYFGKDPKRRQLDKTDEWVNRFIDAQTNFTKATVSLTSELQSIKGTLQSICKFSVKV